MKKRKGQRLTRNTFPEGIRHPKIKVKRSAPHVGAHLHPQSYLVKCRILLEDYGEACANKYLSYDYRLLLLKNPLLV